jgi:dienelactone hydrolase
MPNDRLADFETSEFTHEGVTHPIHRKGSGPAVLVIAEIPGITPKVADFARRVADIGCTAVMPELFGFPGWSPYSADSGRLRGLAKGAGVVAKICVSREFTLLATGKSSPVVDWLRALGAAEHERCGGPGIGAVGMCLTGGFALSMAVDDRLLAPVLSQPSMPFGITSKHRGSIDISAEDLDRVKQRCADDGLQVVGLRFTCDRLVPDARFDMLKRELGEAFVAVELSAEDANPDADLPPHSVLTEHLVDKPGEATRAALDLVLDHFRSRLLEPA